MKTRKELTEEYKQTKFRMGVFQIRNVVNEKIFIESSINLDAIWNRHRLELDFGGHRNKNLQKDWKEFGDDKFKFEILSEIEHREAVAVDYKQELKLLEKMYLEELQPFEEKGYNQRPKQ
ncbi:MAG: GIY-YIG nuclease family protein [Saprospiraceae bacterium]